ncbi:hypothetical protein [Caballeronia sp. M23-90]
MTRVLILSAVVVVGMYFVYGAAIDGLHNIGETALQTQHKQ